MNATARKDFTAIFHALPKKKATAPKERVIRLNTQCHFDEEHKVEQPAAKEIKYTASIPVIRRLMMLMDRIGYAIFCVSFCAQLLISVVTHMCVASLGEGWALVLYGIGFAVCVCGTLTMVILRNLRTNVECELHKVRRQLRKGKSN